MVIKFSHHNNAILFCGCHETDYPQTGKSFIVFEAVWVTFMLSVDVVCICRMSVTWYHYLYQTGCLS